MKTCRGAWAAAVLLLGSAAGGLAQMEEATRLAVAAPNPWSGLQPLRVEKSALLGISASSCPVENPAAVQKDLKDAADKASLAEGALGLTILFLTHGEAAKAEEELIPGLLSKAKNGASALGYWDKAQALWYGNSKASQFQVCRPAPGVVVVRPVKGVQFTDLRPASLGRAMALQPLPTLSSLPDHLSTQYVVPPPPVCDPVTTLTPLLANLPMVTGRATERNSLTGAIGPSGGRLATLYGPSPASCTTGKTGTFVFRGLAPGDYTLLVGIATFRKLTIQAGSAVNLGDLAP